MDPNEDTCQPQGKRKLDQCTASPDDAAFRNVRPRRHSRSSAAALTPEGDLIKDLNIIQNTQKSKTLHRETLVKIVDRFFPRSVKEQVDDILGCLKKDEFITDGCMNYLTEALSRGIRQRSIALIAQDCSTRDRMLYNLRVLIHDAAKLQNRPYEDEIEARFIPRTPFSSRGLTTQATTMKDAPQTPKRHTIVDPAHQPFSAPMKLQRTTSASPTPRFGCGRRRDSLFVEAPSNNGAPLGETQCPLSSSLRSATLSDNSTVKKFVRPSMANIARAQQTSHAPVVESSTQYQNSHAVVPSPVAAQHRSVSLHSVSPVIDLLLGEDSESINYLYQDSVVSRIIDAVVERETSNANLNTTKFFDLSGVVHDFRVNESHAMAKRLNAVYDSVPQDSTRLRRGLDESLQPLVRYNKLKFPELSDQFFVKEKLEHPVLELLRYDDPSLPRPLEMPRNKRSLKGKTTMDRLLEALKSRVSKLTAEDVPSEIPMSLRLDRPQGMAALLQDSFDKVAAMITKGVPYDRTHVAQDLELIMERAARVWANAFRELRDYPFMSLRDATWDLGARELGAGDGM